MAKSLACCLAATLLALNISGCAEIQHVSKPQQALGKPLLAGVGDVVLRIDKQRDLENVVGKADMWGRKTNEGYIELRYAGLEPSGQVVLARRDVNIVSNETTLSRMPMRYTSGQANTSASGTAAGTGNYVAASGTATTNYQSTTISSPDDFHVVVPSDAIAVRLAEGEVLPVAGLTVRIIRATPNSLEYSITSQ